MTKYLLLFLLLFSPPMVYAQSLFQDISDEAGVRYNDGNKNHGIAFGDYDNDGDEDMYSFTRLNENALFDNQGDGTFVNVAGEAKVNKTGSTRAAVWGDLNNDGWLDLYVANYQASDVLYISEGKNGSGQVTFRNITQMVGINNVNEPISVHFADVDKDGFLDIYVVNYLSENRLYRNKGTGATSENIPFFEEIAVESGVVDDSYSMGSIFFDYDRDGDLDLYLPHDFEVANILYQNDGTGHFTNVAAEAGVDFAGHNMGVDVADINHDGWMDMYITDLNENVLYLNNGDGTFSDISAEAGIADTGMGWSTFFADVDNDGWVDIYVVNDSNFTPETKPNLLYQNQGDNTFHIIEVDGAVSSIGGGVGGACADINNDGTIDIAVANTFGERGNELFQNLGNSNHWVAFELKGTNSNVSAVGTKVKIEYGDNQMQVDEITAGNGFAGQNSYRLHFGLREHESIDLLTIEWASGEVETYSNMAVDQIHQITETSLIPLPSIDSFTVTTSEVEQYGKFEAVMDITAAYENPYNYDEITIQARFFSPDGEEFLVDGFFGWDYTLNTSTGGLTPMGNNFKIRFSPNQTGIWTYQITVTDMNGSISTAQESFECVAATSSNNKGFVRTGGDSNYLQFDNGEQYIAIGENIGWQNGNAYIDYKKWLDKLSENGGNFFRMWHAHWGLGIEWKNGWNGFKGLRQYKPSNNFFQDWLFDYCAENDMYVMLCIQHHGQVSTQVNPNWSDSPYNSSNGGPCSNTSQFFTNSVAKSHTKNRIRYIIARWGYSRSIMAWELFNEVEWTDSYNSNRQKVRDWHEEMADYIKLIDPYQHLVTTSYAHDDEDPEVWNNPDMDITQTHFYINTTNIERALSGGVRSYLNDFGKPTLTGEFGLGGSSSLANADPDGIHIHNALWGALFGGGMGTGMTWWWDNYIHPRDLYYHFAPVRTVADQVPFLDAKLQPNTSSFVTGAPGDLVLTPTLGWGTLGDEFIEINENGTTNPANPGLSTYLYGSAWNTQYRSPPTFSITYPESGTFTVRTGSNKNTAPKIAIYLNEELVLEEDANTNKTYTINIPAGENLIKVDNTGTDWIEIDSYSFSGAGSGADSYILTSADQKVAAGWVLNNQYNHEYVGDFGAPDVIEGGEVVVNDFEDGEYFVSWFDCLTGDLITNDIVTASNNQLMLPMPNLQWDLAFLVNSQPVSIADVRQALDFNLYPNPVVGADCRISITTQIENTSTAKVTLFDMAGKVLKVIPLEDLQQGEQALEVELGDDLVAGLYWVRVDVGGKWGNRVIVVGDY